MREILLCSGGLDSFCAYHFLGKPRTVYFDLRTRYAYKEKSFVLRTVSSTIIDYSLDLSAREEPDSYVPYRNLLLATQAARYADKIYLIGLRDDDIADNCVEGHSKMSEILSIFGNREVMVLSPFWAMTKEEIVRWYLCNVSSDPKGLLATVSCYDASETNYCGNCACCFRKWVALRSNGIEIEFYNNLLMNQYGLWAQSGKYIPERNRAIMREVERYRKESRQPWIEKFI